MGLIGALIGGTYYYWTTGYNNNLIHKYKPSNLLVDSKVMEKYHRKQDKKAYWLSQML
jgi:hypothetical protein